MIHESVQQLLLFLAGSGCRSLLTSLQRLGGVRLELLRGQNVGPEPSSLFVHPAHLGLSSKTASSTPFPRRCDSSSCQQALRPHVSVLLIARSTCGSAEERRRCSRPAAHEEVLSALTELLMVVGRLSQTFVSLILRFSPLVKFLF